MRMKLNFHSLSCILTVVWLAACIPISAEDASTSWMTAAVIPPKPSAIASAAQDVQWQATLQAGQTQNAIHQATRTVKQTESSQALTAKAPGPTPIPSSTPTPSPSLTPTKAPTSSTYGAPLVSVPAGVFTMGSDDGHPDEQPAHTVFLDAFFMDKYEVTNKLYSACVEAGACGLPHLNNSYTRPSYFANPEYDNYPVVFVDWFQAKTYCEWRGGYLPTEAQWEKAARGTDGRIFPWGNETDCSKANYDKNISSGVVVCPEISVSPSIVLPAGPPGANLLFFLGYTYGDTTAVGSYPSDKSPYGAYDLAGNVSEWVADWFSETYYRNSPTENPPGPDSGQIRVVRGGYFGSFSWAIRSSYRRVGMDDISDSIGFRCARDTAP